MFKTDAKERLYDTDGYIKDLRLSEYELRCLRKIVTKQYLGVISQYYPELFAKFENAGMKNYHNISSLVEHSKIWPKLNRCLPESDCQTIKSMPFWALLKKEFGSFRVGEVVYENEIEWGRDEMYWRIVRPNSPGDVGTLHADRWFHETMNIRARAYPPGSHALKIWIPLFVQRGKNGLAIVPNSHKQEWSYRAEEIQNTMKPRLEVDESQISTQLLETDPGEVVIFNEDLVHVGAVNRGDETRVSLEITMVKV